MANSISAAARDNSGTSTDKGRGPSAVGSASLRQAHGEELPDRAGAAGADSTTELADSQGEYAGNVSENFRALSREVNTPLNSSILGGGDDKPSDRKPAAEWTGWSPEPNVGRVVNGCANRVDRIRLLGNGVVPQTAAKAWITLNEEFNNEA